MEIVLRRVDELIPYAKNTKLHDKKQIANVANSIKRFGWQQPIVIDDAGVVVIGHCRLLAAKKLGMREVPCTVAGGLTPEEIRELRIADNKTNESPWDVETLAAELEGLSFDGFDLDFGIGEKEREVIEDEYDKAPPKEPESRNGQVWVLGRHRLMVGDSTKYEDVHKLMGGKEADMLLTDPPYNVDYKGKAGKIKNDSMEDTQFRAFLCDAFTCAKAHMKPGAAFHIWHADSEGYNFRGGSKRRRACGQAMPDLAQKLACAGPSGFPMETRAVPVWRESAGVSRNGTAGGRARAVPVRMGGRQALLV